MAGDYLAWRNATTPLPTEVEPKLIFDRLFSDRPDDPDRLKRGRLRASVLDAVKTLDGATAKLSLDHGGHC